MNLHVVRECVGQAPSTTKTHAKDPTKPAMKLEFVIIDQHTTTQYARYLTQLKPVIVEAFRHYAMMEWVVEDCEQECHDQLVDDLNSWTFDFMVPGLLRRQGFLLVAVDRSTDSVVGGCLVDQLASFSGNAWWAMVQKKWRSVSQMAKMFWNAGAPPMYSGERQGKWTTKAKNRVMGLSKIQTEHFKVTGKDAHLYLQMIGVGESARGYGVGSLLLPLLNKIADATKLPIYLETDEERLKQLYQRHGYEVKIEYEIDVQDGGPFKPNFGMYRKSPQSGSVE